MLKSIAFRISAACMLAFSLASPLAAFEIITAEDITEEVIVNEHLVRVADNIVVLFDTSSSMNEEFRDSGRSKLEIATAGFKERVGYFPEIGHLFAVYDYTPWREVYAFHDFDREEVAQALETLPERGRGSTPLAAAAERADEIVSRVSGQTVVLLFYDGQYTGPNPDPALWKLAHDHGACLVFVSSADERENEILRENVPNLNPCSRVITFDDFADRPEHLLGLLYDVEATKEIVTKSDQRVIGADVDNLLFNFDEDELTAQDRTELDRLGRFLAANPETYIVVAGYTDNVGIPRYNEHLSRRRAEMVANYLNEEHEISNSRMVLHWYGERNPVATNETEEGRAQNRRVEVLVGGI